MIVHGLHRVTLDEIPAVHTPGISAGKLATSPSAHIGTGGGFASSSGGEDHVPSRAAPRSQRNYPVAYFHGGGFVAANACVLTQSVVPLARGGSKGGFDIYAADYPMGKVRLCD